MPLKGEFVEIGSRCFLESATILFDTAVWGAHWIGPGIVEYGSVCFTNMIGTHMLGLERVQYR
jgi:hypothetical protein